MAKALKVNADYESALIGKPQPQLSEALEFLAFYLESKPVHTRKKYSEEFLEHVQTICGRIPEIVNNGDFENWWGKLLNVELERKLNSKVHCAEFLVKHHLASNVHILREFSDLQQLDGDSWYVLKTDSGMSGKGNKSYHASSDELHTWIRNSLAVGPMIAEPLYNRRWDFSTYVIASNEMVHYQNVVDHNFQYRGTIISDIYDPSLEKLAFYSEVPATEWVRCRNTISLVTKEYHRLANSFGFCLDSFVHDSGIRSVCEVNYRRTMGLTAYEIGKRYCKKAWVMLLMSPSPKSGMLKLNIPGVTVLSPGDTRFEMFMINASDVNEGREKVKELARLLPEGKFAIEF